MQILMKLFHAARIARPDLLRANNALGYWVNKWGGECRLDTERLICYCHTYPSCRQYAWTGDAPANISSHLHADVDLAGE